MLDKSIIGKKCNIIEIDGVFSTWDNFFEKYNVNGDYWEKGYSPLKKDSNNWEILGIFKHPLNNTYYEDGIVLLQKQIDDTIRKVIYDKNAIFVIGNKLKKCDLLNTDVCIWNDSFFNFETNISKEYFNSDLRLTKNDLKNWSIIWKNNDSHIGDFYYLSKYFNKRNHSILVKKSDCILAEELDFCVNNKLWNKVFRR